MATTTEPVNASQAKAGSLRDALLASLPLDFETKVRYIHTPPKACDPLFSPPPGSEPERTRLSSHFLTASIRPAAAQGSQNEDVLVLGIEVLVYSTKYLTTIFVSKADSTGYLPAQRKGVSPAKAICTSFLDWLSRKERHAHPSRKLVISLFARAQSQYLFPGSAENVGKHVLDDRQLVKWWARVLDPLFSTTDGDSIAEYHGYITVPGYESNEIRRSFFPPSARSPGHWRSGHPLSELAAARKLPADAPPRCLLPRFPDDPKARFMTDLDDEVGLSDETSSTSSPTKRRTGKWSTIRSLDAFWEAMEFRQECSSGRLVGFVWVVIRPENSKGGNGMMGEQAAEIQPSEVGAPSSDPVSQHSDDVPPSSNGSPKKRRRKPLTGPIIPRQPRLKIGSSSSTATSSSLAGMLANVGPGEGLVLSKEAYDKAMQTLLHLDFTNLAVATESTRKWVREVGSACGVQGDWSIEVTGSAVVVGNAVGMNGSAQVNELSGMVRKKRKVEEEGGADGCGGLGGVNVLGSGKVRKKPKVADEGSIDGVEKPAVNVLGAGMVRKKPKAHDT